MKIETIPVVQELSGTEWEHLYAYRFPPGWKYLFVGGLYYSRDDTPGDFTSLFDLSLMPDYCHTRIPPIEHGGQVHYCALYVKMPLVCVAWADRAEGLFFPTHLRLAGKTLPLWFSLTPDPHGVMFRLGLWRRFEVQRKPAEAYQAWIPSRMDRESCELSIPTSRIAVKLHRLAAPGWQELVRGCVEQFGLQGPEPDEGLWSDLMHKALSWLAAVWDDRSGLFLEWKWRHRRGFKGGLALHLFTYHTLAADLLALANATGNPHLAYLARRTRDLILDPAASLATAHGRVWHNTVAYDPFTRTHRFFTHLGTGIGGYPGGQATVLRTLIERLEQGDADPRLHTYTRQGLDWLVHHQRKEGAWPRIFYIFPETSPYLLEPHEWGPSVGSTAEGALVLLRAGHLLRNPGFRDAGLRALHWVNATAGKFPITSGYLRDNRLAEPDGVSAIRALEANLVAHRLTGDPAYLETALVFADYGLTWVRWWHVPTFDPLAVSFTPRLAHCETAWAAEAWTELARASGQAFWDRIARRVLATLETERAYPGFSEATYLDEQLRLHPHAFACVYTASAVLRACRKRIPDLPRTWSRPRHSYCREAYPNRVAYLKYHLKRRLPGLYAAFQSLRTRRRPYD